MAKSGNTGIRRIILATRFSMQGFAHAFRHEAAFRQELALAVVLTPAAFWLGRSNLEIAMLISAVAGVLLFIFGLYLFFSFG